MLGIAREEQSNPVKLKFFRGTTGANVVADATPDADRTLRLQSTVPHFSLYPYIGLGHCYKRSARPADATPDADRTLRLRSTVSHFFSIPLYRLGSLLQT